MPGRVPWSQSIVRIDVTPNVTPILKHRYPGSMNVTLNVILDQIHEF
jgi:hypothetical protein